MMRPQPAHSPGARPAQAMVEFAMMIVPLFLIVFGTIEIGRGVWYYNQLSQLAREGTRWLIVTTADNSTAYLLPGNVRGTYQVASCGCTGDTAIGWIAQQDIGIPRDQITARIYYWNDPTSVVPIPTRLTWGVPVTVELEYPYHPLTASFLKIPTTLTLKAKATMHLQ